MLLNRKYYQNLFERYSSTETLALDFNTNITSLSHDMIIDKCRRKEDIHINFPTNEYLPEIGAKLFVELSNRFAERQGGYTRIIKKGHRVGDNAQTCIIQYLDD